MKHGNPTGHAWRSTVVAAIVTLGWASGCGASSQSKPHTPHTVSSRGQATATGATAAASNVRGLKGDEDDDDSPGQPVYNHDSIDADGDNDITGNLGKGYYDEDDGTVRDFGHAANTGEARTYGRIAERFLAAESRADGPAACAMMKRTVASALPEEYGTGLGGRYLRGARTCAAVMSRVLKHLHGPLSHVRRVTSVRVANGSVYILLGSTNWPASYIALEREKKTWRVAGLLPIRLS